MGHSIRHSPESHPEFLPSDDYYRNMQEIYEDPDYASWLDSLDNHSLECVEVDVAEIPF